MKHLYLPLLAVLVAGGAWARPISEAEAAAIAAARVPSLARHAQRVKAPGLPASTADAPLYVFTSTAGGFAIVAGNDSMPTMILGYSESGTLNLADCPPALLEWLDGMAALVSSGDFSRVSRSQLDYSTPVAPMVATKWNQGDPYNLLTPLGTTGEHCPTGCVATAMAQVMKYWNYPTDGGLCEHSYTWKGQTLSIDFRDVRYDWAQMTDVYDSSSTEAQQQAVAELMYGCGVACNMDYGDQESGSNDMKCAAALVDVMGYSDATRLRMRMSMDDDAWFALVKDELDAGRPLVYMGSTVSNEGHAFVCDGYDTEGLYHINWGWGGMCDGYFDLNTLDPDSQGIGGAASGEGFSQSQSIIAGLQPPYEGQVAAAGWEMGIYRFYVEPLDAEGSAFDIRPYFINSGYRAFDGEVAGYLTAVDGDGSEGPINFGEFTGAEALQPGAVIGVTLENLDASALPDGTYEMTFQAVPSASPGSPVAMPVYTESQAARFEIKEGKLVFDPIPDLTVENYGIEAMDYYVTTGDGVRCVFGTLSFDVTNNSGINYTNGYTITVEYAKGVLMPTTHRTFYIYTADPIVAGETVELSYDIFFNVDSDVTVTIGECVSPGNESENPVFSGNTFTFKAELLYHELELAGDPTSTENAGEVTITVPVCSCLGDPSSTEVDETYAMSREVTCDIYREASDALVATAKATYSGEWHQVKELVFTPDVVLPNGRYVARFGYTSMANIMGQTLSLTLGEEEGYDGYDFTMNDESALAIPEADDAAPAELFTLSGLRLDASAPLAPGLYLRRSGDRTQKMIIR